MRYCPRILHMMTQAHAILISTRERERETCIRFCTNLTTHVTRPSVRLRNDVSVVAVQEKQKVPLLSLVQWEVFLLFLSFLQRMHGYLGRILTRV